MQGKLRIKQKKPQSKWLKRQLCLKGKVINKPGEGELHPLHRGPLEKPFFASLLLHCAF